MNRKIAFIALSLAALFSCNSTPPQKIKPAELDRKIDNAVIEIVRIHEKFGTTCSAVNEAVEKAKLSNEESGLNKNNDIFNYTLGIQMLMLGNYSVDYRLKRIKRFQSAFVTVKETCSNSPQMSYANALQSALSAENS